MRTRSPLPLLLLIAASPAPGVSQAPEVVGTIWAGGRPGSGAVVSLERDGSRGEGPSGEDGTSVERRPVIDQKNLRFHPSVVVVRTGTRVEFLNSDPILHNVFSPGLSGERFDLGTYPSGTARSHVFREPGAHVILCHVHPEMAAYVVVVTTPYHAVTGPDGAFAVEDVLPGRYRLKVWKRGMGTREDTLVVPAAGRRDLVLDLSSAQGLLRRGRP